MEIKNKYSKSQTILSSGLLELSLNLIYIANNSFIFVFLNSYNFFYDNISKLAILLGLGWFC